MRFIIDERLAVSGHTVTDLTHLLAELAENAVRFSPPRTHVTIGSRPLSTRAGAQLLTIEDWGVGMPPPQLDETNELLANPPNIDLSVAQRLGFHVVARLAQRHDIEVSLVPTPGNGITAVVVLPAALFAAAAADPTDVPGERSAHRVPAEPARHSRVGAADGHHALSTGKTGWRVGSSDTGIPWTSPSAAAGPAASPSGSERAERTLVVWASAGPSWDGWWNSGASSVVELPANWDTGGNGHPTPRPRPREDSDEAVPEGRTRQLNRRRPQTHLAPELLTPSPRPRPTADVPGPRPASEALSRYQASRQAAQADVDKLGLIENGEQR